MSEPALAPASGAADELAAAHGAAERSGSIAQRVANAVGVTAAMLLAPAAVVYLSFNAGGFFPVAPGIVAIVFAQALLVRTMAADRPFEGIDWRLGIPVVAFALLAAWQLASALWSHAPARAIDEYDRTLLYVLVFAFYGSMAADPARVRWLIRGLALGIAAVCAIAFVSRALPHVWPTQLVYATNRLSYPLTYWNAEGMLATVGLILAFHLTCDRDEHWIVRVLAACALPGIAATLLFTFSRGALGVALVGLVAYAFLARPSSLLTGLVATAAPVAVALRSAYDATLLAGNDPTSTPAVIQGHHVALTVGACTLAAGLIRAALLVPDRWLARLHAALTARRRLPPGGVPVATAAVAIVIAVALGGVGFAHREYSRFVNGGGPQSSLTRDRLTDPFNDSRLPLWRLGLDAFRAQPLRGDGAGTYQVYFLQHRPNISPVVDAHSLYIQILAESGGVGLALLLVVLLGILVLLAGRIRGPNRALYAVLFAVALAWAIHSGIDWDWQMPAVTLWLFALAGLALGRRRDASPRDAFALTSARPVIAFAWLVLSIAPLLGALSYSRLQDADTAMTAFNCTAAKHDALSSLSVLSIRPQPYAIIGLCDIDQGYAAASISAMQKAESYDPNYWEYHYTLALALAADQQDPRPELRTAQLLDRYEPLVRRAVSEFATSNPERWAQLAPSVSRLTLETGV